METKIDIKRALRVFNIITQRGSKTTEGWPSMAYERTLIMMATP
jgi:hypothetical protein